MNNEFFEYNNIKTLIETAYGITYEPWMHSWFKPSSLKDKIEAGADVAQLFIQQITTYPTDFAMAKELDIQIREGNTIHPVDFDILNVDLAEMAVRTNTVPEMWSVVYDIIVDGANNIIEL